MFFLSFRGGGIGLIRELKGPRRGEGGGGGLIRVVLQCSQEKSGGRAKRPASLGGVPAEYFSRRRAIPVRGTAWGSQGCLDWKEYDAG